MTRLSNVEFRTLNGTAPIFPGKANYWVIVVREPGLLQSNPSQELADETVRKWWSYNMQGVPGGELRAIGVYPAQGVPSGKKYAIVQPQPLPLKDDQPYVYVALTWDATNNSPTEVNWPWDTGAVQWLNDWEEPYSGLIAVYQPGSIVEVPDAIDNLLWALKRTLSDVAEDAGEAADKLPELASTALVWVAIGAASLFALGRAFK